MFRFPEIPQNWFFFHFQKQINFHGRQNPMIIYFFIEHINELNMLKSNGELRILVSNWVGQTYNAFCVESSAATSFNVYIRLKSISCREKMAPYSAFFNFCLSLKTFLSAKHFYADSVYFKYKRHRLFSLSDFIESRGSQNRMLPSKRVQKCRKSRRPLIVANIP